jgi:hypothetical protein
MQNTTEEETFLVQFTDRVVDGDVRSRFVPASQQFNGFKKDNQDVELVDYKISTTEVDGAHRATIVAQFKRRPGAVRKQRILNQIHIAYAKEYYANPYRNIPADGAASVGA